MHRFVLMAGISAAVSVVMLATGPALAVTAKQKMETCKFGADDQKLQGRERAAFLKKCMSNKNDPRGPAAGPQTAAPRTAEPDEPDEPDGPQH
jgi:hypothetical protein